MSIAIGSHVVPTLRRSLSTTTVAAVLTVVAVSAQPALPNGPLVMRTFSLQFASAGTFALAGEGWPSMSGTWTTNGRDVTVRNTDGPSECAGVNGRYTFAVDGQQVSFEVIADSCEDRRMILDRSHWLPPGVAPRIEPRRIIRTAGTATGALPAPARLRLKILSRRRGPPASPAGSPPRHRHRRSRYR